VSTWISGKPMSNDLNLRYVERISVWEIRELNDYRAWIICWYNYNDGCNSSINESLDIVIPARNSTEISASSNTKRTEFQLDRWTSVNVAEILIFFLF